MSYSLQRLASKQVSAADAEKLAALAFAAWQNVECPLSGQPPSIHVGDAGPTGCTLAEYSRTGANANAVLFRDDYWPYENAEDAVGLTTVSFDSVTGQIYDADIEINGTVQLSVTDAVPPEYYDLLSILTHEAGHFLGLGHSQDPDAVMRPSYEPGTPSLRVPNEDDIEGICSIYPPERHALPCDFTPRGGFANECPLGIFHGGCAVSAATPAPRAFLGVLALAALGVRRRWRARHDPRR